MPKFRKKPIIVEAMRFMGPFSADEMYEEWGEDFKAFREGGGLVIFTLEGRMLATVGDWIVRGTAGEFYPVKNHIFEATYEPVEPRLMGECNNPSWAHQKGLTPCDNPKCTGKKPSVCHHDKAYRGDNPPKGFNNCCSVCGMWYVGKPSVREE